MALRTLTSSGWDKDSGNPAFRAAAHLLSHLLLEHRQIHVFCLDRLNYGGNGSGEPTHAAVATAAPSPSRPTTSASNVSASVRCSLISACGPLPTAWNLLVSDVG